MEYIKKKQPYITFKKCSHVGSLCLEIFSEPKTTTKIHNVWFVYVQSQK